MSEEVRVHDPAIITNVLKLQMNSDIGWCSVREYLVALSRQCWIKEESFGGKRPFGNSGWKGDVELALVRGEFITGVIDEEGCLCSCDSEAADRIILGCFDRIASRDNTPEQGSIIKSLQEQIAELRDRIAHADQKNHVLEGKLKRAVEGRAQYRVQVEQKDDQIRGLEVEIATLMSSLGHSEEKTKCLSKTCVNLSDRIDSLLANANPSTRVDLERKLKKSYEKCSELSLKVGSIEEASVKLEKDHAIRVSTLESGIDTLKHELTIIQNARDCLRRELQAKNEQLDMMSRKYLDERFCLKLSLCSQWFLVAAVTGWFVFCWYRGVSFSEIRNLIN